VSDVLTPEQRHRNMSAIRGRDTRPELAVRRSLHRAGLRFRLHQRGLPGCPDLVFPSRKVAVFVHGCFWHKHSCKYGAVLPKTNAEKWEAKRAGNVVRDRRNSQELNRLGWRVFVIWECEVKDATRLARLAVQIKETLPHEQRRIASKAC